MSELTLRVVGDKLLQNYTFAHCDLSEETVRAIYEVKYPANCVVKTEGEHEAIVWIDGIVKLTFGKGPNIQPPFLGGVSVRSNESGYAVWCDPLGEHSKAIMMSPVEKVGDVFFARLI